MQALIETFKGIVYSTTTIPIFVKAKINANYKQSEED